MELTEQEINAKIATAIGYSEKEGQWSRPADKHGTVVSGPFDRIVKKWATDQNEARELVRTTIKPKERVTFIAEIGKFQALAEGEKRDSLDTAFHLLTCSAREICLSWLYTRKVIKPMVLQEVV